MKTSLGKLVPALIAATLPTATHGANLAFDNASSGAYNGGWTDGSNGGFGWGPWSLESSAPSAGFFISGSTFNGDGADDGSVGGLPGDSDIDTTVGSTETGIQFTTPASFGMNSPFTTSVMASRSFTGGPLGVGQAFEMTFDNGFVDPLGLFEISLLNASGDPLWRLQYDGSNQAFGYLVGSFFTATDMGFGSEGFSLAFQLLGPTEYSMSLERSDGESFVIDSDNLAFNADLEITGIEVYAAGINGIAADGDFSGDLYINSMAVVPEPSLPLLGALSGIALLLRRRRA